MIQKRWDLIIDRFCDRTRSLWKKVEDCIILPVLGKTKFFFLFSLNWQEPILLLTAKARRVRYNVVCNNIWLYYDYRILNTRIYLLYHYFLSPWNKLCLCIISFEGRQLPNFDHMSRKKHTAYYENDQMNSTWKAYTDTHRLNLSKRWNLEHIKIYLQNASYFSPSILAFFKNGQRTTEVPVTQYNLFHLWRRTKRRSEILNVLGWVSEASNIIFT